jgi:hypothetical protein
MTASPNFRRVVKGAASGEKIIPMLQSYLRDPTFPSFVVPVHGFEQRPPDGWFHPSTHPLWTERQLYYYLTEPEHLAREVLDDTSTMAITSGNFWHSFVQNCLYNLGLIKDAEVYVEDKEAGARGSMDGEMEDEVFEFKTMNDNKMAKIASGGPTTPKVQESFRALCPPYFAQGQTYMRMSGLRRTRFLIATTGFPFQMRELVIDYDQRFAMEVRDKYLRVRQAVADQRPPDPCCGPRSKESKSCVGRMVCPIAMM